MTDDEYRRLIRFITTVWPNHNLPVATQAYWRRRLDEFPHDLVMASMFEFGDDDQHVPHISQVIAAVRDKLRRIATQESAQTRALTPFGSDPNDPDDRRWNTLSDVDQQMWVDQALQRWRGDGVDWIPFRRDSPLVQGMAAWLERTSGIADPPSAAKGGRCRGCGGTLLCVDRDTRTFKCDTCFAESDLTIRESDDAVVPSPRRERERDHSVQRCATCPAVLIPSLDRGGDRCRNCVAHKPEPAGA